MSWKPTLEYFAGLIDGEGHIGCQVYSGAKRPVIQLQMTDPKAVKAFAEHFGMTLRELNSPSHKEGYAKGYKQIYHTRCECHRAYNVIKQLRPYLITKAKAADEALAYYEDRHCIICNLDIPVERAKSTMYCSAKCSQKAWRIRQKEKEPVSQPP